MDMEFNHDKFASCSTLQGGVAGDCNCCPTWFFCHRTAPEFTAIQTWKNAMGPIPTGGWWFFQLIVSFYRFTCFPGRQFMYTSCSFPLTPLPHIWVRMLNIYWAPSNIVKLFTPDRYLRYRFGCGTMIQKPQSGPYYGRIVVQLVCFGHRLCEWPLSKQPVPRDKMIPNPAEPTPLMMVESDFMVPQRWSKQRPGLSWNYSSVAS